MRKLTDSKIVLASHNKGKLREIQVLLEPFGIECVSAGDLGLEEPEETETTFAGNARLKAHFAAKASGRSRPCARVRTAPRVQSRLWGG